MKFKNGDAVIIEGSVVGQIYENGILLYQVCVDDRLIINLDSKAIRLKKRAEELKTLDAKEYRPGRFK